MSLPAKNVQASPSQKMATIDYIGYAGRANMGDDAILLANSLALGTSVRLRPLPLYRYEWRKQRRSHPISYAQRSNIVLFSGGTAIGRWQWREILELAGKTRSTRPFEMLGLGVEDPSFGGLHSGSENDELKRHWPTVLAKFSKVSVRGPLSAKLLEDLGVKAQIDGDPALLLRPPPEIAWQAGLLGVSVCEGDDQWGHDPDRVRNSLRNALARLQRDGWRVCFLVVNERDRAYATSLAEDLSLGKDSVRKATSPSDFLKIAASCEVMLAERLHAGVLAAACSVPTCMVAYQPKCEDFMASIEQLQFCARTDQVTEGFIYESICFLAENRGVLSSAIADRVAAYQQTLMLRAHEVAARTRST